MMSKGKFGLSTAVIAFAFAALRQPTAVLLVAGFSLLAEKDAWLNRQALQALLLSIAYYAASLAVDWVFGGLARFFGWIEVYAAQSALAKVNSIVGELVYLALLVFAVIALARVARGADAALPWLSKMAGGDLAAAFEKRAAPQQPAQVYEQPQYAQSAYEPPAQPYAQAYEPPQYAAEPYVAPEPPASAVQEEPPAARSCPACSSPLQGDSKFCTECGARLE